MKRLAPLLVLITILLAACAPTAVRDTVGEVICAVGQQGDNASLALTEEGWFFDPGEEPAFNLIAFAGGENLASDSEHASPFRGGLAFFRPEGATIDSPILLSLTGSDRSISITYYRSDRIEPLYCRVRE